MTLLGLSILFYAAYAQAELLTCQYLQTTNVSGTTYSLKCPNRPSIKVSPDTPLESVSLPYQYKLTEGDSPKFVAYRSNDLTVGKLNSQILSGGKAKGYAGKALGYDDPDQEATFRLQYGFPKNLTKPLQVVVDSANLNKIPEAKSPGNAAPSAFSWTMGHPPASQSVQLGAKSYRVCRGAVIA